ncbi:hypothetical protein EZZ80_17695 [Pseudomonas putida]|nr:hypothetical protein DM483_28425 [Pseudomonas sp. SMT-1]QDW60848.1 hypothetical protein FFH79_020020 [Pseudomonas sp. KBS0802]UZA77441.1 hypothetical protein EZZ80_17695 [Pseudomonas putida]
MLPTPSKPWLERRPYATPVGADSSANTGRAGAKLRGACFAGKPACMVGLEGRRRAITRF